MPYATHQYILFLETRPCGVAKPYELPEAISKSPNYCTTCTNVAGAVSAVCAVFAVSKNSKANINAGALGLEIMLTLTLALRAGLHKAEMAFIQAFSMQPVSQTDIRTFFFGVSS